jgi:hypothetical protein
MGDRCVILLRFEPAIGVWRAAHKDNLFGSEREFEFHGLRQERDLSREFMPLPAAELDAAIFALAAIGMAQASHDAQ